jgi:sigma-54 dependent transcriptional regulator
MAPIESGLHSMNNPAPDGGFAPQRLIAFPKPEELVLSIRAKALVFDDPRSSELLSEVERIAASDVTALIVGETGTGKELVARHIHERSGRKGPFIAVNCGAFSEALIDAELFGHESGAFTGATQSRQGWFEAANGGTLFLDEIGDMPLALQVKLLRVLQEKQVVRIGSRQPIAINVRLVAATNVELWKAVQAGRFRTDLFYRLNVAPISLPPLRDRRGDIMPLVHYFGDLYGRKLGLPGVTFSEDAENALFAYDWPGNIRELENVVHFAVIVSRDGRVERGDLRLPHLVAAAAAEAELAKAGPEVLIEQLGRTIRRLLAVGQPDLYETVERVLITTAFDHCSENQVRTARELSISRNVLRAQLKRFGLLADRAENSLE